MIFEPGHHSDFPPPLRHRVCVRSIRVTCDNGQIDRVSLCAWVMEENRCGVRTRKCFTAVVDLVAKSEQKQKRDYNWSYYSNLLVDAFATEKDFPKALKRAFIKYNTSISFSAHVERLFSAGGLIFDNLRGKMSDKNFEMALLLKFNKYIYKQNIYRVYF